jgi:hypothetical protein
MTPQNLLDYVKVYPNFLSKKLCKQAILELKHIHWEKHRYHNPLKVGTQTISYDDDLFVNQNPIKSGDAINKKIWLALEKYVVKDINFPWFNGWQGYTLARFNRYDAQTLMRIHCDHIHTLFEGEKRGIPVLSIVGTLNDDYEGGEFLMFGEHKIDLPAGSIVVFPSNFLYPHEVTPIKTGVRYSYVSWTW